MSNQLTDAELAALMPSELCAYQTPIPTQIVSSDEFYPDPQNERQREVEARLLAMADELGGKQGLNRRRFFQSAAGMAASFVAMNEVYGPLFDVTLGNDLAIDAARILVSLLGRRALAGGNLRCLLTPTLLHRAQTPLGAATRGADGATRHGDEDGVRV